MDQETAKLREGGLMPRCLGYLSRRRVSPAIGRGETTEKGCRGFRDETGSTLVEFSISALLLFAMIFGIIEMSFAAYSYHYVASAAREAARYAIVRGSQCINMPDCNATSDQIQTHARSLGYPNSSQLSVVVKWLSATGGPPATTWVACTPSGTVICNLPGNAVNVVVTDTILVGIPKWGIKSITLSSTSQMVISQ
jgi:Flp pilus assembly protein TadG